MTGTVFGKWYWSDWMSDPGVRASSYAARGLWMDLLCLAAMADPTGYVVLNGRPLTASEIARLTGGHASEVETLLDELARNGVFTRDRHGRIYSRRMVRETRNAKKARENGKKGGNPTLLKHRDISPPDNPPDNGRDNTHKPEARSQKAGQAQARAREGPLDDVELERLLREASGLENDPSPGLLVLGPIHDLLGEGFDLHRHVLPVLRALRKRRKPWRSWRYVVDAVRDENRSSAGAGAHQGEAEPETPPDPGLMRRHRIRTALDDFRGEWRHGTPDNFRPSSPLCDTPPDVLAEARAIFDDEQRVQAERMARVGAAASSRHH